MNPTILNAVDDVNNRQKSVLVRKISDHFGNNLADKTFAIWGLAFKPKTDDVREAPALVLINFLLEAGCRVRVYDPEAMENVRAEYGDRLEYANRSMDAIKGADVLAINTEWDAFRHPDFEEMKAMMNAPVIFDGRNLYDPKQLRKYGFTYHSIGRPPVLQDVPATYL
jgi:UDPglucose 6-dehydrogenase